MPGDFFAGLATAEQALVLLSVALIASPAVSPLVAQMRAPASTASTLMPEAAPLEFRIVGPALARPDAAPLGAAERASPRLTGAIRPEIRLLNRGGAWFVAAATSVRGPATQPVAELPADEAKIQQLLDFVAMPPASLETRDAQLTGEALGLLPAPAATRLFVRGESASQCLDLAARTADEASVWARVVPSGLSSRLAAAPPKLPAIVESWLPHDLPARWINSIDRVIVQDDHSFTATIFDEGRSGQLALGDTLWSADHVEFPRWNRALRALEFEWNPRATTAVAMARRKVIIESGENRVELAVLCGDEVVAQILPWPYGALVQGEGARALCASSGDLLSLTLLDLPPDSIDRVTVRDGVWEFSAVAASRPCDPAFPSHDARQSERCRAGDPVVWRWDGDWMLGGLGAGRFVAAVSRLRVARLLDEIPEQASESAGRTIDVVTTDGGRYTFTLQAADAQNIVRGVWLGNRGFELRTSDSNTLLAPIMPNTFRSAP